MLACYPNYKFTAAQEVKMDTLELALSTLNTQSRRIIKYKLSDIEVTDSALFTTPEGCFEPTAEAFERFCGLLGIPRPFARHIPEDLLNQNIQRLMKEYKDFEVNFTTTAGLRLIGVQEHKNDQKKPFDLTNFLIQVAATKLQDQDFKLKELIINDQGINLISTLPLTMEPVPGDITEIGLAIQSSDSNYFQTMANLALYRLVCTNGAVLPSSWGKVVRSTKEEKIEDQLTIFSNKLSQLKINGEKIGKAYKAMPEVKVEDEDFVSYWTKMNSILKAAKNVDKIMEIDEDSRKYMKGKVTTRKKAIKNLEENVSAPATLEDVSYYDIYNRVTSEEKNQTGIKRKQLLKLGGTVLTNFFKKYCSKN